MSVTQPHGDCRTVDHGQARCGPATLVETRVPRRTPPLRLRPILPQDADLLAQLLDGLSPAARRNRFHGAVRLSPSHFRQMSTIDPSNQLAVVVSTMVGGSEQLIADARYVVEPGGQGAEFALLVADRWQGQGVGAWAMQVLQRAATNAGLIWLQGDVLQDNLPMLGLMRRCGFALSPDAEDDRIVKAQRRLGAPAVTPPVVKHGLRYWLRHAWPPAVLAVSAQAANAPTTPMETHPCPR